MLYISDNLKWLRSKRNLSQQDAADGMKFGLDQYKKYEYGKNTPPAEALLVISRFYHISIDLLLTIDLRKVIIDNLLKLEDNRIVLPIIVDSDGNNLIEIVPHKAHAGYLAGYSDPEFIESLQHISLPFLTNGKYRAFPVTGDSMPPHKKGSFVVGEYIERVSDIVDGKTYILITKNNGMSYKRLYKKGKNAVIACSDNAIYKSYEVLFSDVLEIWCYACSIATDEFNQNDLGVMNMQDVLQGIRHDITALRTEFNQRRLGNTHHK